MKYTVIGGKGFIGSKIVKSLESMGDNVWIPNKGDKSIFKKPLGVVIYCAGHGDCNNGIYKVFDSNSVLLSKLLELADFERIVYISSTRIYMNQEEADENSNLTISENDSRRLFNLTKLLSEELLMKSGRKFSIIRPSNTYGMALKSPLFLPTIVRNAVDFGEINMHVSSDYAKDYISVDDVAELTVKISKDENAINEIFNIASGENIKANEIIKILVSETSCKVNWHSNESLEYFPITNIDKILLRYNFKPRKVLNDLESMIKEYKQISQCSIEKDHI